MNPTNDIAQLPLRDIHLPGAVAWWPPAPGWWLLAALALAGVALVAFAYYRGRHRRAALRTLEHVRTALEQGAEPVSCLQSVSTVLRRFAMTSAARGAARAAAPAVGRVAGLIGEPWLAYLDSRWQRSDFTNGPGRVLLAAPYARPDTVERATALELVALSAAWLKAQRRRTSARAEG
jgi:hypothetical protein